MNAAILSMRVGGLDRHYLEKWIHELGLTKPWDEAQQFAGIKP